MTLTVDIRMEGMTQNELHDLIRNAIAALKSNHGHKASDIVIFVAREVYEE